MYSLFKLLGITKIYNKIWFVVVCVKKRAGLGLLTRTTPFKGVV